MEKNFYKKLHRVARKAINKHWDKKDGKYLEMLDNKKYRFIFDIVFHGKNPRNLEPYYACMNRDYELKKHFGI